MRMGVLKVFCAGCILLCANNLAFGQDGAYRQLTADDFRGAPRPSAGSIAYTNCTIDFHYHAVGGDNNYRLTFDVQVIMQHDKSWIDKRRITSDRMLTEVLKHEQGHYNIAFMEQQEILREAARTRFTSNYKAQASALFDRIHTKYEHLNANYDDDTRHMLDATQQHSWDVYFQRRLAYMPPVAKVGY
ncbi:hypothetical protein [Mucilaginibacter sp. UR6-11]|uniref:DUF922 domain-containing protein n=1 Tax=Mucilaginibacter sp. UR6-11 TaxID=1435644 RepID=UPI001E5328C7|nr:hypothetical protein [Mucilaginibacter sp. UR6-11]MCC8424969.1 hypothetical protein [Mucilaginibacter sp. UR6-11]